MVRISITVDHPQVLFSDKEADRDPPCHAHVNPDLDHPTMIIIQSEFSIQVQRIIDTTTTTDQDLDPRQATPATTLACITDLQCSSHELRMISPGCRHPRIMCSPYSD